MATDVQDMELTDDEITGLLSQTRAKGQYTSALSAFVESGSRGRKISLTSGQFAGKAASSLKTGFNTAIGKAGLGDQVRVIAPKDQDYVALVNTAQSA